MSTDTRVLLVEDDESIVEIVRLGLSYEEMECVVARDGVEALRLHQETHPDIVVLDLMLPELDGLTVLERIRARRETPVIVLTARDAPDDRVAGLQAGADDYLTKPFHFPELVARIRAVLRRRIDSSDTGVVDVADLRIDRSAREVTIGGKRVELTTKQFDVLDLLASNAKRVLSKDQIYEQVWGWDHMGNPNVVEQHISHLRDRIDRGRESRLIHTVRGVGYVLREEG
ncbi:MAG: response regulator transcription factor [Actinomycetota bacterium]